MKTKKQAFTLIELVIVIAIMITLVTIIFVSLDPIRRFRESRNARRWSDVHTILESVVKYRTDHEGEHFSTVEAMTASGHYMVGTCASGGDSGCEAVETESACVDLSGMGGGYMTEVPKDPRNGTDEKTGYYIMKWEDDSITVGACTSEGEGATGMGEAPDIRMSR